MPDPLSLPAALTRIAARGLEINSVIDVGASNGQWSDAADPFWPQARFHLIEAFHHWKPALEDIIARKKNYSYTLAACGPQNGETSFYNTEDNPCGGGASTN